MADTRPGLKKHIAVCHPAPNPDPRLTNALLRKMSATAKCPMATCRSVVDLKRILKISLLIRNF